MAHSPERADPAGGAAEPLEVVLVGAGARALAWLEPLRRAARLRPVATVARGAPELVAGLPVYGALEPALRAHPQAAFAVALPPRAGLEHALQLAAAGRAGVVQAPLHAALADVDLGAGAAAVRVAHGWVTLPGLRLVAQLLRRGAGGAVDIEVSGLPEDDAADAREALVHGAALLRFLLPDAVPRAARQAADGGLEIEATAAAAGGEWSARLRLRLRERRAAVRVETAGETALWSFDGARESVRLGEAMRVAPRTPPTAAVRALAQLLADADRGDGLREAAAALRLAHRCLTLLPAPLPLAARAFRQSAALASRRPADLLARLGLRGALPAGGVAPGVLAAAAPPEPFELWAFRAGVKPVVFLTLRPDEVERTLAYFDTAHCERRERRVQVGAQDLWSDRRDEGEPRVELYIARDAALARRMAELQAEDDPTRALRELGALAGYPECCVDAFALQDDRANNSRNRYYSQARTAAVGAAAPWPWELNNLHTMAVAFYPCSYRCAAALAWARAALAELARRHPDAARALRAALARPVLYFDHDHQIVCDGAADAGAIAYRSLALPRPGSAELRGFAAALAPGERLTLDDQVLRVEAGGRALFSLQRTDPGLGFIAPFA